MNLSPYAVRKKRKREKRRIEKWQYHIKEENLDTNDKNVLFKRIKEMRLQETLKILNRISLFEIIR